MMEILFHAKRKDNGGWVEGQHLIMWKKHFIITGYDAFPVEAETVGAYTGLTDKNKNKIFEGDIVKTKYYGKINPDKRCNFADYDVFVITYDNGGFCTENKDRKFGMRELDESTRLEVIGNIYDNPELLEESKK